MKNEPGWQFSQIHMNVVNVPTCSSQILANRKVVPYPKSSSGCICRVSTLLLSEQTSISNLLLTADPIKPLQNVLQL